MRVAIVGAGWAGLAAAVAAIQAGHRVTVFEASRTLGGRARALPCALPNGSRTVLDNGQHILIGAYTQTLRLMRLVGVDPDAALLRLPLALVFSDGGGVRFPRWPAGLDALGGILLARGWTMADKASLLRQAVGWRLAGFQCTDHLSVATLCAGCSNRVMAELVEPLCVSALNTPASEASARVFLRVVRDALFGAAGGSNLIVPRQDLSALFPDAAARWAIKQGADMRLGMRVQRLVCEGAAWQVNGQECDTVLLATPALEAVRILRASLAAATNTVATEMAHWSTVAGALQHRAITTVYAWGREVALPFPMLALRSSPASAQIAPAQFVFDRGLLGGPSGLLAFVVSASAGEREALQSQVLAQAKAQLGHELQVVKTVIEKTATFACTPGLQRPPMQIAAGLLACGDYVDGPYPSTLEGAVRSGLAAIQFSGSAS